MSLKKAHKVKWSKQIACNVATLIVVLVVCSQTVSVAIVFVASLNV